MKCTQCSELIGVGQKYKEVSGGVCHAKCFLCNECGKWIDGKYFPYKGNEYYHQ